VLPWLSFPAFAPKIWELIGIDCKLGSSAGGRRVSRTFVSSSPIIGSSHAAGITG
jgi:hypothetical protein